jgi:hypothetical protein
LIANDDKSFIIWGIVGATRPNIILSNFQASTNPNDYLGQGTRILRMGTEFVWDMQSIGDYNLDGFGDMAISFRGNKTVYVVFGSATMS